MSVISDKQDTSITASNEDEKSEKLQNMMMNQMLRNNVSYINEVFDTTDHVEIENITNLIHEKGYYGKNVIEMACAMGRTKILKIFSKHGVDFHKSSNAGYSLLHIAAAWGQKEVLRFLDTFDFDWLMETNEGETPEMIAKRYEKTEAICLIKKAVSKMELKNCICRVRETLADPEKMQGIKVSRDEKNFINNSCNEKLEWLATCLQQLNDETEVTIEDIKAKELELEAQLKALFDKAQSPPQGSTKKSSATSKISSNLKSRSRPTSKK